MSAIASTRRLPAPDALYRPCNIYLAFPALMDKLDEPLHLPGSLVKEELFNGTNILISGWVGQPRGRGTIDILWSSSLTIFLCTWTVLCLNVPDRNDGKLQVFLRRAKWMFWAIVWPELVLSVAIGQRASAVRSVKRFKALNFPQWTIRHGFFADMGGILLQPQNSTPFLVNSRQLAYLVEEGYAPFPDISEAEIWDRSKADTLTKAMTIIQASWLVVQIIGRAIIGIDVTTLELSAASIVFCTLGTFFCWLQKPSDVQKGIVLHMTASTEEILRNAGESAKWPYLHTPLDFVAKQNPTVGYDVMKRFGLRCDSIERPLRRFPNDRFLDISTTEKISLFCMTLTYAALHLVGWNFSFPSFTERLLWRISSCFIAGTTLVFWVLETIVARHRFGRWDKYLVWLKLKKARPCIEEKTETEDERREREQKAAKPTPTPLELALLVPITFFYALARGYMIVEVFMSLRTLPVSAFNTVDIVDMLPTGDTELRA